MKNGNRIHQLYLIRENRMKHHKSSINKEQLQILIETSLYPSTVLS